MTAAIQKPHDYLLGKINDLMFDGKMPSDINRITLEMVLYYAVLLGMDYQIKNNTGQLNRFILITFRKQSQFVGEIDWEYFRPLSDQSKGIQIDVFKLFNIPDWM